MEINFAIVMSTYKRADDSTPIFLKRALTSIKNQTYKNYKVFLIGDKYESPEEVYGLLKELDDYKVDFENLTIAKEREKYTGINLWSYGGVNAINHGINKALSEGYEYICHLDHDDWWDNNHLEVINECIKKTQSDWICTKSTYKSRERFLPHILNNELYVDFKPMVASLTHSSACMNFKKIPLRYRDIIEETGEIGLPADADLWERTRDFIEKNNLKSTFINILTCHHDEEGYELHNNKSVQPTIDSINKINHIILNMEGRTFHNHYHILYDLCSSFSKDNINYLEIGTYCGASASLMASHEKVRNVFSIDIGNPINKEIPISNVKKFKNENCNYLYIEGDSREKSIVTYVKNNLPKIDILFIDGDHSYNAVIEDFNNYKDVVSKNGFIVFDDYMDFIHSPHVNSAVNDIVKTLNPKKFEIIGSVKYNLLKETNEPNLESSNEFIIRKK